MVLYNHNKNGGLMEGFFEVSKAPIEGGTQSCISCGLYLKCNSPKIGVTGAGEKGILLMYPHPGEDDDKSGNHWTGASGRYLRKILKSYYDIDVERDCWTITALDCRPKGKSTGIQLKACRRFVVDRISQLDPKVIISFGSLSLQALIAHRWLKDFGSIDKWEGWQIPDQDFKTWICPVKEPKDILRKKDFPEVELIWKEQLCQALSCVHKSFPDYDADVNNVQILEDEKKIVRSLRRMRRVAKEVAFDIETTGLKPQNEKHQIHAISFASSSDTVISVPMYPINKEVLSEVRKLLEDPKIGKIAQNMKFEDTWMLEVLDIKVTNWVFDTMLGTHVLDNRVGITSLKFQTYVQFGVIGYEGKAGPYLKSNKDEGDNGLNRIEEAMSNPSLKKEILLYCGLDSLFTIRLAKKQRPQLIQQWEAYRLLHDGILSFARTERHGMRIDVDYVARKKKQITRKITHLRTSLEKTDLVTTWRTRYGEKINMNSPVQLQTILYEEMGLTPVKRTPSGKGSTDEESLSQLDQPALNLILKIRKLLKLKDTYLENFLRETVAGRMHPVFNLHTVKTYRSSSNAPNFHNIPKRDKEAMTLIRSAIFPSKGNQLVEFDFSKLEVSIAACYHKDPKMIEYLTSEHNDMHGDLAQQIFFLDEFNKHEPVHGVLRAAAKNGFIFPQFYGDWFVGNAEGLRQWIQLPQNGWKPGKGIQFSDGTYISDHMRVNGIKEYGAYDFKTRRATGFIKHLKEIEYDFWHNRFPMYKKWKDKWVSRYRRKGYLDMLTGFRCKGPMLRNEVINYPVQGAAFHCLLWAFIQLDSIFEHKGFKTKLIGQIHDAIVLDVAPEELDEVADIVFDVTTKRLPEAWTWINVPLQIEAEICPVDASWAEKKDWLEFNKRND